jgi:hypothetical protein
MFKELVEITKDETEASQILKMIGIHGTFESGKRQVSVLRMFPNDPIKVMEYLDVIWYVIFGTQLDEYELVKIPYEGKKYPDMIFNISKCPICGGYGTSPLDSINCSKIHPDESNYATGLVGMLEETTNFILELKKNEFRVVMHETKCFCKGDNTLELKCHIVHMSEFNQRIELLDEILQRPFLLDSEINQTKELLSKPMDAIKEQLKILIQDKLNMSSFDLVEYFRDYEEDAIKIIGFLLIHIANENGRLIEKACENVSIAKLIGHVYNNSVEMAKLTLPFEVLEDYKKYILDFLADLAPSDVLERFSAFKPMEVIELFYEGIKKGLIDLGVDFEGLKSNIWEEMEIHKKLPQNQTNEDSQETLKIKMELLQEMSEFIMGVLGVPSRLILSSIHGSFKSILSSSEFSFTVMREKAMKVLELINKLP